MRRKDALEKLLLERFLAHGPDPPKGRLVKSESPDFLVEGVGGSIGIELTGVYMRGSVGRCPREEESMRNRVTEEAKQRYYCRELPLVDVTVVFRDSQAHAKRSRDTARQRKPNVAQQAEMLADLVAKNIPAPGGCTEVIYDETNWQDFPEAFLRVKVVRHDGPRDSIWSATAAAPVCQCSSEALQKVIGGKEKKLSQYRAKCRQVWLVMCSEADGLSSLVEPSPEALDERYLTGFDRVFWFAWPATVRELAIRVRP